MKKRILMVMVLTGLCYQLSNAQIMVKITGSPIFNTSELYVTEAGLDYSKSFIESQSTTFLNIENNDVINRINYNWKLYVSLAEMNGSIVLEMTRTGEGTKQGGAPAFGLLDGAMTAMEITTIPIPFMSGKEDRINIPVKFTLRNLSVVQPVGNVTFSLIFTATEF